MTPKIMFGKGLVGGLETKEDIEDYYNFDENEKKKRIKLILKKKRSKSKSEEKNKSRSRSKEKEDNKKEKEDIKKSYLSYFNKEKPKI